MQRFRHPNNLRNDPKFRSIEKKLDEAGYARAVKLIEIVAEVGGKGEEFCPEFALRDNDAHAWSEQIVRIPLLNVGWLADEWCISTKKLRQLSRFLL